MARRKNTKTIDPRYFMDEKMERLDESTKGTRRGRQATAAPAWIEAGLKPNPDWEKKVSRRRQNARI